MDSTQARFVRARKDHVCAMCDRRIRKGTTYAKWAVFADGGVWVGKAHQTCREIGFIVDLNQDDWGHGPPLGEMYAKEVWQLATTWGLDTEEVQVVWGTREEAEVDYAMKEEGFTLGTFRYGV